MAGTVDFCIEVPTTGTRTVNIVGANMLDVTFYDIRLLYNPNLVAITAAEHTPFVDNLGAEVGLINLPWDSGSFSRREVFPANAIDNAAGNAFFTATWLGERNFPDAADEPHAPADEPARPYTAGPGGVPLVKLTVLLKAAAAGQVVNFDLTNNVIGPGNDYGSFNPSTFLEEVVPVPESNLFDGAIAVAPAVCPEPPTPAPTPTPGPPTPTPGPPGTPTPTPTPDSTFGPLFEACLDNEATPDPRPPTVSDPRPGDPEECDGDNATGASSAIRLTFGLPKGDVNFSQVVTFMPTAFEIALDDHVPDGTKRQELTSIATLGLLTANNPCNTPVVVKFDMLDATIDKSVTVPFGDTDGNGKGQLFEDKNGNGLPDAIDRYPDFNDRILGPAQPIVRTVGITNVAGVDVLLQFLLFQPSVTLQTPDGPFTADPGLGYPGVILLQNIGDPDVAPTPANPIHDLCSPVFSTMVNFGKAADGTVLLNNPSSGGLYGFSLFARGLRDADGDGHENALDPCPLTPDPTWDPRATTVGPGDADGDGLPTSCDPNDQQLNTDQDADLYHNRLDNCTLAPNGDFPGQDNQKDSDFDQIGDACDPDPASPDGDAPEKLRQDHIIIAGLPATPIPTPTPTPTPLPPGRHDARAIRISTRHTVNLRGDGAAPSRVTVTVANDGDHLETIGIYLDVLPPADGGCQPSGRVRQTSITLNTGSRRTLVIDGYPGDPLPGDGFVTFSCTDPLAADGLNYTWFLAVDAHADDLAHCSSLSTITDGTCLAHLSDDDLHSDDNVRILPLPVVSLR